MVMIEDVYVIIIANIYRHMHTHTALKKHTLAKPKWSLGVLSGSSYALYLQLWTL